MKTCPKCKIRVGGDWELCPLCQGELVGEASEERYPHTGTRIRRFSLLYRILVFCLLTGVVVCVAVDWMTHARLHWSLIAALAAVVFLLLMRRLLYRRHPIPSILFQILLAVSFVTVCTDFYVGYTGFSVNYVVPMLCAATLVVNFVLAFVPKRYAENALVYVLMNMVVGALPYLILLLAGRELPLTWILCLLISIVTFLGLVVFQWRRLFSEMHKRLHL